MSFFTKHIAFHRLNSYNNFQKNKSEPRLLNFAPELSKESQVCFVMNIIEWKQDKIKGVLSTFDRIIIKGYSRQLSNIKQMGYFLSTIRTGKIIMS